MEKGYKLIAYCQRLFLVFDEGKMSNILWSLSRLPVLAESYFFKPLKLREKYV